MDNHQNNNALHYPRVELVNMLIYSAKLWWKEGKKKLAAYLLRDTTTYLLEQHVGGGADAAEINKDGCHPTYWKGKHDGLMVALRIGGMLNLKQFKDAIEESRCEREQIEKFERWQNRTHKENETVRYPGCVTDLGRRGVGEEYVQ